MAFEINAYLNYLAKNHRSDDILSHYLKSLKTLTYLGNLKTKSKYIAKHLRVS